MPPRALCLAPQAAFLAAERASHCPPLHIGKVNGSRHGLSGVDDLSGLRLSPLGVLVFRGIFSTEFDRYTKPERVYTIGGAFFVMRLRVSDVTARLKAAAWQANHEPRPVYSNVAVAADARRYLAKNGSST